MPAISKAIKLQRCKSLIRTALLLQKPVLWFRIQLSSENQEAPFFPAYPGGTVVATANP